jgi:hypothetical protein
MTGFNIKAVLFIISAIMAISTLYLVVQPKYEITGNKSKEENKPEIVNNVIENNKVLKTKSIVENEDILESLRIFDEEKQQEVDEGKKRLMKDYDNVTETNYPMYVPPLVKQSKNR